MYLASYVPFSTLRHSPEFPVCFACRYHGYTKCIRMRATVTSNRVPDYTLNLSTRQLYDNCAPRDSYRHILTNRTAALRRDVTSCL